MLGIMFSLFDVYVSFSKQVLLQVYFLGEDIEVQRS